jgi:hypothetical protein
LGNPNLHIESDKADGRRNERANAASETWNARKKEIRFRQRSISFKGDFLLLFFLTGIKSEFASSCGVLNKSFAQTIISIFDGIDGSQPVTSEL